ncbi:S9 family peptidase [Wenyingzhuangia sp. 2_MG-2023]|uniref:S9 family peptidase n=1 Tax=Wenyingzhuangia sp. 2_MG-2023 TaxID=3062639 RepID=UPI0026E25E7B|nr:S9 family peptidase [Wenyingzhuangia sp. 2_MG-2023]MDO6738538.1 DPP IV N-terminal domain-containing protein [Wenyingzhuangia sp. 2_MG-2023]
MKLPIISTFQLFKNKLLIACLILVLLVSITTYAQKGKTYTTADYDRAAAMLYQNTSKLIDNNIYPQWLPDGRVWYLSYTANKKEFKLYDPEKKKLLTTDTQRELIEKGAIEIKIKAGSRTEILSPDEKYVAFIRDWNLWIREVATHKETALTTDGIKNFGYATDNAGWKHSNRPILSWSPDSKKIATFQQDQRHVSDMYLVKTKVGTPELSEWKYPLPGDEDIIRIHRVIIHINPTPKIVKLHMDADARRGTLCDDISCEGGFDDVAWSEDGSQLAFVSTSRDHKEENVRIANTETGAVKDVFQEVVATQYESGQGAINWKYFSKTDELLWYSERSDWGHLYLYNAKNGKLKHQITSGEYVVREVVKVDEKKRLIYFTASHHKGKGNPYYSYLYRVDFSGKHLKLLTPEEGNHTVRLSPDNTYFIDSYSQSDVPPVHQVKTIDGKLISLLEKTDLSRLKATGWKAPTSFTVKSADGSWDLYGLLFTPTKLQKDEKLPVIVQIYPGPQGGTISVASWGFLPARSDAQALAELGFAVVQIEGSCNPNRSKSFHDACYGNMAENTLSDQIAGLKQLKVNYPFLDLDRVGIWGHSGGGFATAAALLKYPDFFKVGISESGNHDNRNYEDDWGERYIGLETKNNMGVSNYELQANQMYAENLKGELLIIHGGMDDNVPPYNSYLLVDALIKANKDFDFILLPNARHGYGKDSNYIMRRRWDYFLQHLMKATPPKNYKIEITPDSRN